MPETNVTVNFIGEDDVTPALNKIKGTIDEVTQSTAALVEEGRLLTQGFERAGISIANAMRLGSQEQKAAMQAYMGSGGGGRGGGGGGSGFFGSQAEKDQSALRIYGMELENFAAKTLKAEQASKALAASQLEAAKAAQVLAMFEQRNAEVMEHVAERERAAAGGAVGGGGVSPLGGMLSEMGEMAGTFLKWGVIWQVFEAGLKGVEAGIGQVVGAFQVYDQWSNKLGADNQALGSTFNGIVEAAIETGTSIQETSKRVAEFYAAGFDTTEAVRATEAVQIGIKQTGVDLTQAYTEANLYKASIQSLKDVAARTGDEKLQAKAVEEEREQNTLKYYKFEMQQRQQAEGYALADSNRAISQYTEAHQRAVTEEMADRQRATRQDLEEKLHAIERERAESKRAIAEEMDDAHRAAAEAMEDRHRAAREAEADADRLHNRQMGAAGAIKSLTEAAVAGTGVPVELQKFPGLEQAYNRIRTQLEKGYAQFAKDTGVSAATAKAMTQAGIVSPGEILQEAKVPVEEERIKAERGRAKEEREFERRWAKEKREYDRAQEKEDTAQQEMNYQARKQTEKSLGDEERKVRKELAAERLSIEHEIADSERELTRRNAQERDELAKHFLTEEIERIGLISQARIKAQGKELDDYKAAMKAVTQPVEMAGAPLVTPVGAPSGEAPASEGTLEKIQQTLERLLSGS